MPISENNIIQLYNDKNLKEGDNIVFTETSPGSGVYKINAVSIWQHLDIPFTGDANGKAAALNYIKVGKYYTNKIAKAGKLIQFIIKSRSDESSGIIGATCVISTRSDFAEGYTYRSINTQDVRAGNLAKFVFEPITVLEDEYLYIKFLNSGLADVVFGCIISTTGRASLDDTVIVSGGTTQNAWTPVGYLVYSTTNIPSVCHLPLEANTFIKSNIIYDTTINGDVNYSAITMQNSARAEIWLTYKSGVITWPDDLIWSNGEPASFNNNLYSVTVGEPVWKANTKYLISVVCDSPKIIAKVTESYSLPVSNDSVNTQVENN